MARISIREIEYFVNVAQAGSVSAAAARLRISQPAVGLQVKQLEAKLNTALLERHSRGVSLTPAGKSFLGYGLDILETLENAQTAIARMVDTPSSEVRVGVTPSLARMVMPRLLQSIAQASPKLQVHLSEGMSDFLLRQVQNGELDCAFCYDPMSMKNVSTRPLYSEDLCLIGPQSVISEATSEIDLAELENLPLILTPRGNGHREAIERGAQKRGIHLNPAIELDLVRLKLEFIMQNDFCTISPFGLFHHEIQNGRLNCRKIVNPVMSRTMQFVFYRSLNSTTVKRILRPVKTLVDSYIEQPGSWWRPAD